MPFYLFVPGHGETSVDGSSDPARLHDPALTELARALAGRGVAMVRFDRSGCGESEGPPLREVSLAEEIEQVCAAWHHACANPCLDAGRGALLAHSLGMVPACRLVAERRDEPAPCALAIYGGGLKTWGEYAVENARRQWTLRGMDLVAQDRAVRSTQRFWAALLLDRASLADALARADAPPELFGVESDTVLLGRPHHYWQDVHDAPCPAELAGANIDVRAIWGSHDALTSREDHELITACVESAHPGRGTLSIIEGADHAFSLRDSAALGLAATGHGVLAPALVESLVSLLDAR